MQPQAAVTSQHHEENIAENAYTQKTCQSSYETCQRRAEGKPAGEREKPKEPKQAQGQKQRGRKGGAEQHKHAESLTSLKHGVYASFNQKSAVMLTSFHQDSAVTLILPCPGNVLHSMFLRNSSAHDLGQGKAPFCSCGIPVRTILGRANVHDQGPLEDVPLPLPFLPPGRDAP